MGGRGQTGDITLLDESNRQRIFASGIDSRPFLRFENELGAIQILLEGHTGNIEIQRSLITGGVELNGSVIQALLQASQTISGLVQSIQNLEGRNSALGTQVTPLTLQVDTLNARANGFENNARPGGSTSPLVINGKVEKGLFVASGSGFRPNVKCYVITVYPDFSRKVLECMPNGTTKLDFNVGTSALCIARLNLTLNFTVNQPDTSGPDKFTNTVSISCPVLRDGGGLAGLDRQSMS